MNVNEMHIILQDLSNIGQGRYVPAEEIDRALNNGSIDKFNEEKKAFEVNGFISNDLKNFKTRATITLTAGSGPLPANYDYRTNASTVDDLRIDIVPESEWVENINDPIDPPTLDKPIVAIRTAVEVRPITLTSMYLYYLRVPITIVFGYTEDGDGNPIYASGSSTDCDWPVSAHIDIVRRAAVYLGIPLSDQGLTTLETFKKKTENA